MPHHRALQTLAIADGHDCHCGWWGVTKKPGPNLLFGRYSDVHFVLDVPKIGKQVILSLYKLLGMYHAFRIEVMGITSLNCLCPSSWGMNINVLRETGFYPVEQNQNGIYVYIPYSKSPVVVMWDSESHRIATSIILMTNQQWSWTRLRTQLSGCGGIPESKHRRWQWSHHAMTKNDKLHQASYYFKEVILGQLTFKIKQTHCYWVIDYKLIISCLNSSLLSQYMI